MNKTFLQFDVFPVMNLIGEEVGESFRETKEIVFESLDMEMLECNTIVKELGGNVYYILCQNITNPTQFNVLRLGTDGLTMDLVYFDQSISLINPSKCKSVVQGLFSCLQTLLKGDRETVAGTGISLFNLTVFEREGFVEKSVETLLSVDADYLTGESETQYHFLCHQNTLGPNQAAHFLDIRHH